jgi:predicted Zn-dependent protease
VIGGFGPVEAFTRVERDVNSTIRSFRPLTQEEVDGIVPNEIALYIAREGDTLQQISDQGNGSIVKATTLAIMNGYPVNEQPRPGDRLKIVVSGM